MSIDPDTLARLNNPGLNNPKEGWGDPEGDFDSDGFVWDGGDPEGPSRKRARLAALVARIVDIAVVDPNSRYPYLLASAPLLRRDTCPDDEKPQGSVGTGGVFPEPEYVYWSGVDITGWVGPIDGILMDTSAGSPRDKLERVREIAATNEDIYKINKARPFFQKLLRRDGIAPLSSDGLPPQDLLKGEINYLETYYGDKALRPLRDFAALNEQEVFSLSPEEFANLANEHKKLRDREHIAGSNLRWIAENALGPIAECMGGGRQGSSIWRIMDELLDTLGRGRNRLDISYKRAYEILYEDRESMGWHEAEGKCLDIVVEVMRVYREMLSQTRIEIQDFEDRIRSGDFGFERPDSRTDQV